MLTNQMTGWINSISIIGNWNLDTGQAVPVRGNLAGPGLNYNMLQCKSAAVRHQLGCNGYIFDLRSGQVNGKLCLDGAVQTRNGQQVGGVNFAGQQLICSSSLRLTRNKSPIFCTAIFFNQALNSFPTLGVRIKDCSK